MEKKEHPKLDIEDLKLESFMVALNEEELRQVQGSGTYGRACGATASFNCSEICTGTITY